LNFHDTFFLDLETKLPPGFFGFSAVRSGGKPNSDICKDGTAISYTSATANSEQMLNLDLDLDSGVVTIPKPGLYLLSFHGLSSYDSNRAGIYVVRMTGNESSSENILSTHSQRGFTPMSVMRLVKLNEGDKIRVDFRIEDFKSKSTCLYCGNNGNSFITTFTGILVDPQN